MHRKIGEFVYAINAINIADSDVLARISLYHSDDYVGIISASYHTTL